LLSEDVVYESSERSKNETRSVCSCHPSTTRAMHQEFNSISATSLVERGFIRLSSGWCQAKDVPNLILGFVNIVESEPSRNRNSMALHNC
jgi:hypothetical protein